MSDNDFKYLTQEFGFKNLELLKQKSAYSYEYVKIFKKFREKHYLIKSVFIAKQAIFTLLKVFVRKKF